MVVASGEKISSERSGPAGQKETAQTISVSAVFINNWNDFLSAASAAKHSQTDRAKATQCQKRQCRRFWNDGDRVNCGRDIVVDKRTIASIRAYFRWSRTEWA